MAPIRHSAFRIPHSALAALFVAGVMPVVGCDRGSVFPKRQRPLVRIALLGEAKDEPLWPVLSAAARAFTDLRPDVRVAVDAPDTASPLEQRELLEALTHSEVTAVCILPTDPSAIRSAVNDLANRGIPVVTVGRDVAGSARQAYCGPSESEIGQAAARACEGALVGRARTVVLLHAGPDDATYGPRYFGFVNGLRLISGVNLFWEIDCGSNRVQAAQRVRSGSRKFPRVGCWVFLDDWPLRGLGKAERLLPLGCGIVLCKGSPRYFDHVRDGRIRALVTYDARKTIERALSAAVQLAQGDPSAGPPGYRAEVEIVTAASLPSYERRWEAWRQTGPRP